MIHVEEARKRIKETIFESTNFEWIEVSQSNNFTLATTIFSPIDLPSFKQSNVDGYAVCFAEDRANLWKVTDEIKAGDNSSLELKPGQACRIFTGAKVPKNADAVIMQEDIEVLQNNLISTTKQIFLNQQIRDKASQINAGSLALEKGHILNPATISFLNMLGFKDVKVFKKPKIKLIVTGNELQMPGTKLEDGNIFESNANALLSALDAMKIKNVALQFAKDEKKILQEIVANCLVETDFLILSGGISVGDYDFVKEVLDELEFECIFHKIAQKPGKPLYFGRKDTIYAFALPGNPASALTCFYEYIYPAINQFLGQKNLELNLIKLPLASDIKKKTGLAHFLKADFDSNEVRSLEGQESFIMKSFAEANCLIYLPQETENLTKGDLVEIHILP